MNSSYNTAFMSLGKSKRDRVLASLHLDFHQSHLETGYEFAQRCLRKIEREGMMRQLEEAIEAITH